MSMKICYMNGERKKAVACKHPDRTCDPKCPEWQNRKTLLSEVGMPIPAQTTEAPEPKPGLAESPQAQALIARLETEAKKIERCETAIDSLIGIICCNGGYSAGKCPDPNTRPCIVEGKPCKYLLLTVPYFQR